MYIIVGLGNPGRKYSGTRHNAGFCGIDALADKFQITVEEERHKALIGKGFIHGEKVILVKPTTFMNLSGESVRSVVDYYKIEEKKELIVLYDDISLAPGKLRIRKKGSAGGHNGIKNIILHLGHEEFVRIKIGVGEKPAGTDLVNHVLGHFSAEDQKVMEESYQRSALAVEEIILSGPDKAMNGYNG